METIQLSRKDDYVIIQLNRDTANAINMLMVDELRETFRIILDDTSVKGAILTGKEHFFSAGFDLIELYDYDRQQIKDFWTNFFLLIVELVAFPKPLVASITGHSPAGGCVLAFCADYRIMAQGNYKTGMNEIAVGIVVPDSLFKLYSYWIGRRRAYMFLTEGKLFSPEEAFMYQLIDKVVAPNMVLAKAEEKLNQYLQFDSDAWQKSKMHLRADLIGSLRVDFDIANKDTLDQWWSPKARAILKEKVDYLKQRRETAKER
ncbi:MAG: 3,2-trans-enoyl-CoA isomerase [Limisphaerales bacterium]|jgi:3,2-trans-enoyl-CoA isomerase